MSAKLTAVRGDTFSYSFTLSVDPATYNGGLKFTIRDRDVESSVTTDDDAVDQATSQAGEITYVGSVVTITIPASRTTSWPARRLKWDVQGVINGDPAVVHTFENSDGSVGGTLLVKADITRSA